MCGAPPSSRGRPPGEIREGIRQAALDGARFLRGEHMCAPLLQEGVGDAGCLGGRVERPAEMLAGMAQTDPQPVMGEELLVEIGYDRELAVERRRGFAPA